MPNPNEKNNSNRSTSNSSTFSSLVNFVSPNSSASSVGDAYQALPDNVPISNSNTTVNTQVSAKDEAQLKQAHSSSHGMNGQIVSDDESEEAMEYPYQPLPDYDEATLKILQDAKTNMRSLRETIDNYAKHNGGKPHPNRDGLLDQVYSSWKKSIQLGALSTELQDIVGLGTHTQFEQRLNEEPKPQKILTFKK
ncbi:MAG: hypothetical protein KIT27_05965 [Legionellales bacterium]|nr:hypothetical protein [Legionellales bacterium]